MLGYSSSSSYSLPKVKVVSERVAALIAKSLLPSLYENKNLSPPKAVSKQTPAVADVTTCAVPKLGVVPDIEPT